MDEVETILAGLEREDVDIDRLGAEVKRAVELITVCREKLARTDREVRDLVAGLQDDGQDAGPVAAADTDTEADEDKDLPF
jgi:exodeoxyribonuclease VII small subunit